MLGIFANTFTNATRTTAVTHGRPVSTRDTQRDVTPETRQAISQRG